MGGINGGLLVGRPSRQELQDMMRHLDTYAGCGLGAEQDFLTDFWKNKKGIAGLPRRYNCQVHQVALLGPDGMQERGHRAGSSRAIEPVVRMECRSGAIEPEALIQRPSTCRCLVEVAVFFAARGRFRSVRDHRHRHDGRAENRRVVWGSIAFPADRGCRCPRPCCKRRHQRGGSTEMHTAGSS